ncbi:bifunctional 4-hydroxy-2-oxoglutarate aldolase/2-dehydro-3-deoxy-phosphogluconate aldolase [Reichenbachiella sp. MALMAid0571]|uniref:bifunctional 4-hydroxy-2-oxoglutarate aldolase/2-dehydro-3-deoxy-phosphogluconate aldolase n=1 Tax=Reichenbachiella sp. MALMAid0571 TaxID=3143939 RepID=UPI0032DFF4F6
MGVNYKEDLFSKMPVVGIMRNFSNENIEAIVPLYKKAGFTTLEITMNSSNAEEVITHLSKNHPDLNIGAGTVCNIDDLEKALGAGASFIVTPIMDNEVMQVCRESNVPIFPGAFTPLEIYNAWKSGASAVKVFPATQLGPGYVKDVLGPLNQIKLLPTGGVSIDNIEAFFKAGAVGVGMGSTLFDNKFIESKDYDSLFIHFQNIYTKVGGCLN